MNQPVPDELISAYFDGEVTPDERSQVERLLESSPEFRQQLDDTSKLSALLHSFPREAAPAELAARIQEQVRTAVLVPAAPIPTAPRSLRREWTSFGVGILATMASLLMFVTFNKPDVSVKPRMQDESLSWADQHKAEMLYEKESKLAENKELEDLDRRSLGRTSLEVKQKSVLVANSPSSFTATDRDKVAGPPDSSPAVGVSSVDGASPAFGSSLNLPMLETNFSDGYSNSAQPQTQTDFLHSITNGDVVVPRIADPSNTVAVADFTVVDTDRAAGVLKVLLQKRSVQQLESGESVTLARRASPDQDKKEDVASRDAPSKKSPRSEELQVFFVRAPGDQLAGAIDELVKNHPDLCRKWAPQLPIELPATSEPPSSESQAHSVGTLELAAKAKLNDAADESHAATVEADVAMGALLARNSFVNANSDSHLNLSAPVAEGSGMAMSRTNLNRQVNEPDTRNNRPAADAQIRHLENNSLGLNYTGQGYFRVSVQNQSKFGMQAPPPALAQNSAVPLLTNSPGNGAVFDSSNNTRLGNSVSYGENRNTRLVKMLIILKSEQSAAAPTP